MPGDTLADIAARLMPGEDDALERLSSWNLHLLYRRSPTELPGELLGTDIVYVEAPLP